MLDLRSGDILQFIIAFILLAVAIFMRYLMIAALFYFIFERNDQFTKRSLSNKIIKRGQIKNEIKNSLFTSLIFAALGVGIIYAWQSGYTKIYIHWSEWPIYWILLSPLLILLLHESYYYWLHRWMHRPYVYKWMHRTHHESLVTTAWTSFSFHPLESVLQGIPILIFLFVIPTHIVALGIIILIMTLTSVINHLNMELYPVGSSRHWFGRWWIGATHHHLHHHEFHTNFGLYFTFWDRWMRTESFNYQKIFKEKTEEE
ncbi:MAG: sterol desaturase family protein [Saprospiraceae bacterium]